MFIVLEGCDRAGKSTQCQLLVDFLNSHSIPAKLYRFPSTSQLSTFLLVLCIQDRATDIGKTIGSYLSAHKQVEDHAIHLMFSANRWEML